VTEQVDPKEPYAAMWCPVCKIGRNSAGYLKLLDALKVRGTELRYRKMWAEPVRVAGKPMCRHCWHPLSRWQDLPIRLRLEIEAKCRPGRSESAESGGGGIHAPAAAAGPE